MYPALLFGDAACPHEVSLVVTILNTADLHVLTGFRRVDKFIVTQVDAHVRYFLALGEEYQVTGLRRRHGHRRGAPVLLPCGSGNIDSRLVIAVLNQAAAIESPWGCPAVHVGRTHHGHGGLDDLVTEGRFRAFFTPVGPTGVGLGRDAFRDAYVGGR